MKTLKTIPFICLFLIITTMAQAQRRTDRRRYRDVPRYGYHVRALPRQVVNVRVRGHIFHYHAGLFYRPFGNSYIIVQAPIGAYVPHLPRLWFRFVLGTRVYYYYYANYYTCINDNPDNGCTVVTPPIGARIDELPEGTRKVIIDNNTYYMLGNVYYKAVVDDHGEVWYEVVGIGYIDDTGSSGN